MSEWFDILSLLLAAFESNLRVECATRDVKIELEREIDWLSQEDAKQKSSDAPTGPNINVEEESK